MTWLYERKTRRSEKNGKIVCERLFGRWGVYVGGLHESSRYLRNLWRDAYERLPVGFAPKTILMLGLAAGDNITLLAEKFPGSRVTAVEWDEEMVKLANELGLYPQEIRPEIVIADAKDAVKTLAGPYDLVLVDLFTGGKAAAAAFGEGFFDDISRLTSAEGLVIVNAFHEPELLDIAAGRLNEVSRWKMKYNRMGIFRT